MRLETIKNLEKVLGAIAFGGFLTLAVLCSQKAEGKYIATASAVTAVTTAGYAGIDTYRIRKEEN